MGLIGTYYKFTLLLLLSLLLCVIILFSIMLLIWYPFVRQFPLLSPMLNFMAWRRYAVSAVLAARVCLSFPGSYLGAVYCGAAGFYLSPISFLKDPLVWIKAMSIYRGTHTQVCTDTQIDICLYLRILYFDAKYIYTLLYSNISFLLLIY